jgi:hypothetical protein
MADKGRKVQADPLPLELLEPGGEVEARAAAIAGDDRGDPIEQEVVGAGDAIDLAFDVDVEIDKSGSDDAPSRLPIEAMRPFRIPISDGCTGLPVPSATLPPLMRMSKSAAAAVAAKNKNAQRWSRNPILCAL